MARASTSAKSSWHFQKCFFRGAENRSRQAFAIKPEGCYLITGAFGGFGKVLAQWLVEGGARASRAHQSQRRSDARSRSVSYKASASRASRCGSSWRMSARAEDVARLIARDSLCRSTARGLVPPGHGHR